jgi:hypothetical protein
MMKQCHFPVGLQKKEKPKPPKKSTTQAKRKKEKRKKRQSRSLACADLGLVIDDVFGLSFLMSLIFIFIFIFLDFGDVLDAAL